MIYILQFLLYYALKREGVFWAAYFIQEFKCGYLTKIDLQ